MGLQSGLSGVQGGQGTVGMGWGWRLVGCRGHRRDVEVLRDRLGMERGCQGTQGTLGCSGVQEV